MLEPLAALGVASNIIQLVGFGARLVKNVEEVLDDSLDALPANSELLKLTSRYEKLYCDVNATLDKHQQLNESEQGAKEAAAHLHDEVRLLTEELEDLRVSSSMSKATKSLSAVRQTIRSHRKGRDLEARQQRLNELTNLLAAKLLLILSERSDSRFAELCSNLANEDIRNSYDVQKLHDKVANLVKAQEQQAIKERREAIRQSLLFESMDYRRNIIAERYRHTFEWCFNKDSSPLLEWLKSGNEIFWICGKAGSGKSTFMKFLGLHKRTLAALKEWAGSCQLIVAEHFFYYAGSHMQKSHQGLLQSLLSQVLLAGGSQNLASTICSERWSGSDGELSRAWSRDEVMEALLSLGKLEEMRFCFFIDGLDEYYPHTEHDRLIAELGELVAVPNIKICTSSRRWTEFVEAFGNGTEQIRLEDLTRDDIAKYAKENLATATPSSGRLAAQYTPQVLHELSVSITNKAQGVFLWVYLVVSALKEHLKARNSVMKLRECVEAFPAELEDYFRNLIYDRIHVALRNDTAQSLKLALLILQHADEHSHLMSTEHASAEEPSALASNLTALRSFLPLWILHTGMQRPKFAITMEFNMYHRSDVKDMVIVVRHYLSACCKDLLWVSPSETDDRHGPYEYKVEFLHRTVYDFLSSTEMMELLDRHIPRHFIDKTFLLDVTVACLKVNFYKPPGTKSDQCEEFYDAACGIAHIARLDDPNSSSRRRITLTELDNVGAQYSRLYCHATESKYCLDVKDLCCLFEFMISRQLYTYTKSYLEKCGLRLPKDLAPTIPDLRTRMETKRKSEPPPSRAFGVLLASLGLRGTQISCVHQVDEEMVYMLLHHSFSPNLLVPRATETGAWSSVWTVFLQAWLESRQAAESSVLHPEHQSDEVDVKLWQLAKLMIAYSADLTHGFQSIRGTTLQPSHDPGQGGASQAHWQPNDDGEYRVKDVLDRCVPPCSKPKLDSIFGSGGTNRLRSSIQADFPYSFR